MKDEELHEQRHNIEHLKDKLLGLLIAKSKLSCLQANIMKEYLDRVDKNDSFVRMKQDRYRTEGEKFARIIRKLQFINKDKDI